MFLTAAFGDQVSHTTPSPFCDGSQKRGKSAESREAPGGVWYLKLSLFCHFFHFVLAQAEPVGSPVPKPACSHRACVAHLLSSKL